MGNNLYSKRRQRPKKINLKIRNMVRRSDIKYTPENNLWNFTHIIPIFEIEKMERKYFNSLSVRFAGITILVLYGVFVPDDQPFLGHNVFLCAHLK